MKARTILEKRVVSLAKTIKPITNEQIDFCKNKVFKFYYYRTKTKQTCLECNTTWKIDKEYLKQCPNCERKIYPLPKSYRYVDFYTSEKKIVKIRTYDNLDYVLILETREEFQVLRYLYVSRTLKSGRLPNYNIREIYQIWMAKGKKTTIYSKDYNAFNWNGAISWKDSDDFSIKHNNNRFHINAKLYPKKRVLPELKRNGFKDSLHGFLPAYLFNNLFDQPKVETLFKAKYYELANSKITDIVAFWPSIKKAVKHKYVPSDFQLWLDYLSMQQAYGRDILNDKYLFPKDVKIAHDEINQELNIKRAKERAAELKDELERENLIYIAEKEKYFGFSAKNENFNISVLKDAQEFYEEAEELSHCLYNGEYHKKKYSLILSAKNTWGNRVATIEIDLKRMEISQVQGNENKRFNEYPEIYALMTRNMPQLQKM